MPRKAAFERTDARVAQQDDADARSESAVSTTNTCSIDVFNGDADGLCALQQLRLAEPRAATLVTGLKREIQLLEHVEPDPGLRVTVLDLAFDRNRAALERLLAAGVYVQYFDHHYAGGIRAHPRLDAHIDSSPAQCTSSIVDAYLGGRFRAWAVAAAFGDNMPRTAERLAATIGLDEHTIATLRGLGEALNYNSYGETIEDVAIHPHALYHRLHPYADPLEFARTEPIVATLIARRAEDLAQARTLRPFLANRSHALYEFPDTAWARRVLGPFANELAATDPTRAHAILKPRANHAWAVSIRAPVDAPQGADRLARAFKTGGGRAAAAGIDALAAARRDEFIDAFLHSFATDPSR